MSAPDEAPHVLYVTHGWGVHDERWADAIEANGLGVSCISLSAEPIFARRAVITVADSAHLRSGVAAHASETGALAVLAGPLTSVTHLLAALPTPVVGLSWGFDLNDGPSTRFESFSSGWLADLDALIVDSPTTRAAAIALGVRPDSIHLIPWGVDLVTFHPDGRAATCADVGLPSGSRMILSLRAHSDLYRTSDIIEAFGVAAARDPALALVMGGSGPLTHGHIDRIAQLGLSDRFTLVGQVDEAWIPDLMRGVDYYVTTSRSDGTSVTLLQAMACGAPVIASQNAGNAPWVIDGLTGATYPVGDVPALSERLLGGGRTRGALACAAAARALVVSQADWNLNRQHLRAILTKGQHGNHDRVG
jgi:glycosyltransferase involved in cell wall biosynthesis